MSNGKGSAPRPLSVSREEYGQRWDAVFRPKLPRTVREAHVEFEEVDNPMTGQIDYVPVRYVIDGVEHPVSRR